MASSTKVFIVISFLCAGVYGIVNNLASELFSGAYEFIDLTHPFDNNTVYWPDSQTFTFTKKIEKREENDSWYASNDFAAGEHGGTHIDAPYHFYRTGKHVGELPLESLIVPLIIVDVSSIVNDNPNFVLYKSHMDYLLNTNMGKPCLIIFKFGWSKFFHDRNTYLGLDKSNQKLNFPGISAEVAEWVVSYKNVVGVGVDVASIDPGSSIDTPAHVINARAGIYNIENVNLNRFVPDHGCVALVLPMKIAAGTGAPLRLVAICPKSAVFTDKPNGD